MNALHHQPPRDLRNSLSPDITGFGSYDLEWHALKELSERQPAHRRNAIFPRVWNQSKSAPDNVPSRQKMNPHWETSFPVRVNTTDDR
jgi:hypothetical protein